VTARLALAAAGLWLGAMLGFADAARAQGG
jgi:hypothetical protein